MNGLLSLVVWLFTWPVLFAAFCRDKKYIAIVSVFAKGVTELLLWVCLDYEVCAGPSEQLWQLNNQLQTQWVTTAVQLMTFNLGDHWMWIQFVLVNGLLLASSVYVPLTMFWVDVVLQYIALIVVVPFNWFVDCRSAVEIRERLHLFKDNKYWLPLCCATLGLVPVLVVHDLLLFRLWNVALAFSVLSVYMNKRVEVRRRRSSVDFNLHGDAYSMQLHSDESVSLPKTMDSLMNDKLAVTTPQTV